MVRYCQITCPHSIRLPDSKPPNDISDHEDHRAGRPNSVANKLREVGFLKFGE